MSQTTVVALDCREGKAGQLADNGPVDKISAVATAAVKPGYVVELALSTNGSGHALTCKHATSQTLDGNKLAIVMLDSSKEPNSNGNYAAGDVVPCLRDGKIFAAIDSDDTASPPTYMLTANVHHELGGTKNGLLTTDAANTTSGSEITAISAIKFIRTSATTSGVCVAQIRVP